MASFTHYHCGWCDDIKTCDCDCPKCSLAKEVAAAAVAKAAAEAKAAVGGASSTEKVWQCKACGAHSDEDCRPDCAGVRKDIHKAEAAAAMRTAHSTMKKKGCTCEEDADYWCDFCRWEEDNRCRGCGAYPDEKCRKDCRGDEPEECERCGRMDDCRC